MDKKTFTVFTPTFNRANTIHRVYNSLKNQTFVDFEWIIVDDGSKDNTSELIDAWSKKSTFPILFYYQENRGKHAAYNKALSLSNGEYFLTFDSDDECLPTALEKLKYYWDTMPSNQRHEYYAVTGLCVDTNNVIIGDKYPTDIFDSNSSELYYKHKIFGEKWGCQVTDILRQFPFPESDEYKFVPEGLIWNAIARKYKTRFVNEILRIYHINNTDKSDQISKASPERNSAGKVLYYKEALNKDLKYFKHSPKLFFKQAIQYTRFSLHSQINIIQQSKALNGFNAKLLHFTALPLGFIFYTKDRKNLLIRHQ